MEISARARPGAWPAPRTGPPPRTSCDRSWTWRLLGRATRGRARRARRARGGEVGGLDVVPESVREEEEGRDGGHRVGHERHRRGHARRVVVEEAHAAGAGTHEADPWRSSRRRARGGRTSRRRATRRRGSAAARAVGARRARVEPRRWRRARRGEPWKRRERAQDIFFSRKGTYPNGTVMRSRSARVGLEGELRTGFASVRVAPSLTNVSTRVRASIVARSGGARRGFLATFPRQKTLRVKT